ncbi:LITAF-like zinc ribbon domain-containing protein [Ditylenchus destructor]|nr:LITAF-like zinc ribbon domain-containing protein [Ditylenchus destructor]
MIKEKMTTTNVTGQQKSLDNNKSHWYRYVAHASKQARLLLSRCELAVQSAFGRQRGVIILRSCPSPSQNASCRRRRAPVDPDPVPLKCPSCPAQVVSAMNRRARGFAWMMCILLSQCFCWIPWCFFIRLVMGVYYLCDNDKTFLL